MPTLTISANISVKAFRLSVTTDPVAVIQSLNGAMVGLKDKQAYAGWLITGQDEKRDFDAFKDWAEKNAAIGASSARAYWQRAAIIHRTGQWPALECSTANIGILGDKGMNAILGDPKMKKVAQIEAAMQDAILEKGKSPATKGKGSGGARKKVTGPKINPANKSESVPGVNLEKATVETVVTPILSVRKKGTQSPVIAVTLSALDNLEKADLEKVLSDLDMIRESVNARLNPVDLENAAPKKATPNKRRGTKVTPEKATA